MLSPAAASCRAGSRAAGSTGSGVSRQRGAAAAACRPSCLREEHPRDRDEPTEASRGEQGAPALLTLFKGSPVVCGRKEAAQCWEGARHPPAGWGWQGTAVTGCGGRIPCSDVWLWLASSSPHSLPRLSAVWACLGAGCPYRCRSFPAIRGARLGGSGAQRVPPLLWLCHRFVTEQPGLR